MEHGNHHKVYIYRLIEFRTLAKTPIKIIKNSYPLTHFFLAVILGRLKLWVIFSHALFRDMGRNPLTPTECSLHAGSQVYDIICVSLPRGKGIRCHEL